ncbi:uncharacterized protein [Melanerpes formicivorus]|uniref:uncharacterized protein isoform X4 n=1 Tax=Melanerpes formicivorus TaxID=211600 RepID=UPI00358F86AE
MGEGENTAASQPRAARAFPSREAAPARTAAGRKNGIRRAPTAGRDARRITPRTNKKMRKHCSISSYAAGIIAALKKLHLIIWKYSPSSLKAAQRDRMQPLGYLETTSNCHRFRDIAENEAGREVKSAVDRDSYAAAEGSGEMQE